MHVVFDLDGVLFGTQTAIRQSYSDAGVEMPDHAWGLPWQSWLIDAAGSDERAMEIHRDKDRRYAEYIERGAIPTLSGLLLARKLMQCDLAQVGILTGASRDATQKLMSKYCIAGATLYGTSMTARGKMDVLQGIAARGVYIDDHEFDPVVGWRIIRYDYDETIDSLMEKLWMP